MDYVVGSVAALISGNVTPNRPKALKRALTPMKHQPSPNVTPKSESVMDRSIFLSPTMQKKKAIVKKSPKRIFQNPDLDATVENDTGVSSPKADKVKKHFKNELEADFDLNTNILCPKSSKNLSMSLPSQNKQPVFSEEVQVGIKSSPKRKKKEPKPKSASVTDDKTNETICNSNEQNNTNMGYESKLPKKKNKLTKFTVETVKSSPSHAAEAFKSNLHNVEKKKKIKKKSNSLIQDNGQENYVKSNKSLSVNKKMEEQIHKKKKNHKRTKSKDIHQTDYSLESAQSETDIISDYINLNAITNQDTDSEHESDDNIQSDNEESNKAVLDTGPESSDEEDINKEEKRSIKDVKENVQTEEEVKRTLFVGNVPFSAKCKKEIKRIFSKYGEIETIRIRTVPVKDGRVTPKLAVIKNELHPDRSTVNVYIKYAQPSSVNDALVENNTILNNRHLRVVQSDVTGSEHDPKCSVFVGNLPFALEDEALRAKFDKCGDIESVRIIRDRKTNAGKGFGYVNFASKDGVELALALTEEDLTIKNRILRVKRCTQPTTNQLGKQRNKQARMRNQGGQQSYPGRPQSQGRQFNNYMGTNSRGQQLNRSGRNHFSNDRFQRRDQNTEPTSEGAYRRIMRKRETQENTGGPPEKRQKNSTQPYKEKKPRKEFVGITADKKKFQKRKLTKDQKKKKAFSEILTKQRQ